MRGLFSDKDFDSLTYNVMKYKSDVTLISKFPSFQGIECFRNFSDPNLDKNTVIRYIVLCYDKGSPILNRFMQDDVKRKTTAAQYAGWEAREDGLFSDEIDEVMRCTNESVNEMIIEFLRLFNDPNWALLLTGLEAYFQKLRQVMSVSVSGKRDALQMEETKGKLFKQAEEMAASLSISASKILQGDSNPFLARDLYSIIDKEAKSRLKITPERMLAR